MVSLCASAFPLLQAFEDLEVRQRDGFFVNLTELPITEKAISILPSFLHTKMDYQNVGFQNRRNGFTFIEGAYIALKWSKYEHKVLRMDLLSGMLEAFICIARQSARSLTQNSCNSDGRWICQNRNLQGALDKATHGSKGASNVNGARWLDLKTAVTSLLYKILRVIATDYDAPQTDVKIAGSLIRTAATACLIHQKWGERAALSKASLQNLKRALIGIFSEPFLHPLSFAPEAAQQTFSLLVSLCAEHVHLTGFLVDLIADLMCFDRSVGITFLSRLLALIIENFNAAVSGKRAQLYDEVELLMSIIADFAIRKDAILIAGLYLGKLLQILGSDRAALRKCFVDLIGACFSEFHAFSLDDQEALVSLFSLLLCDRDATCRTRALSYVSTVDKGLNTKNTKAYDRLFLLVSKRIVDRSKIVRLKALQILGVFLSNVPASASSQGQLPPTLPSDMEPELVSTLSKLMLISPESPHFCKETIEAAGNVLASTCLRGNALFDSFNMLFASEHSSACLPSISKVMHSHLHSCESWINFLASRSEESMSQLQKFLLSSINEQRPLAVKLHDIMEEAFSGLASQGTSDSNLLGSLRLITLIASLNLFKVPKLHEKIGALLTLLRRKIKELCMPTDQEKLPLKCILKWIMKTLAVIVKDKEKSLTKQMRIVLQDNFLVLYSEGIPGCVDCIYAVKNPHGLTKKILVKYEDNLHILDSPQPLKLLRGYITFIGDLSRSFGFACEAFVKRLREAQKHASGSEHAGRVPPDFDYLQEEDKKVQEEDAVLRFGAMVLDVNSVPGCYIPFLEKVASCDTLPSCLRISAIESLGHYMLASSNVAEKYKSTMEALLQSQETAIKVSSLYLAGKLILAFPNDYLSVFSLIVSLLKDDSTKDAAFGVYANLVLEKKFKLEVLLGPVCDGLCDVNENISRIATRLLKRLVQDAGRSKHKLVISLWNHCTNAEALVQILVEHVLDATDFQSDELAFSVLQILALGHSSAACLASYLHPSYRVLQTLQSYLNCAPPKINLRDMGEAAEHLAQFVRNCKRHRATPAEKELVERLLEQLQTSRGTRKRKNQGLSLKPEMSDDNLEEYEKAIQSFKHYDISTSLWDLLTHDV